MPTFKIYPKEGAPSFQLKLTRFQPSESAFVLYEGDYDVTNAAFLAFDKIAAIIPEDQEPFGEPLSTFKTIEFRVYLQNRNEPISVSAHKFELTETSLKFYWQQRYGGGAEGPEIRIYEIPEFYFAISEVVAIVPS